MEKGKGSLVMGEIVVISVIAALLWLWRPWEILNDYALKADVSNSLSQLQGDVKALEDSAQASWKRDSTLTATLTKSKGKIIRVGGVDAEARRTAKDALARANQALKSTGNAPPVQPQTQVPATSVIRYDDGDLRTQIRALQAENEKLWVIIKQLQSRKGSTTILQIEGKPTDAANQN